MPIYRFKVSTPYQIDYYDTTWLNPDYKYELVIYNSKYDKFITSTCELIGDININKPYPGQTWIAFNTSSKNSIEWTSAKKVDYMKLYFVFIIKK